MEKNIKQIDSLSCTFEEKSKERDLIQSLINRMANSQLQTKIFCISIIAFIILIAFFFAKSNELTIIILIAFFFAKSNELTTLLSLCELPRLLEVGAS